MAQRAFGGKVRSLPFVSLSVRMLWAAGNNTTEWHELQGNLFDRCFVGSVGLFWMVEPCLHGPFFLSFYFVLLFFGVPAVSSQSQVGVCS